ncbi:hypothetical protein QJS04_geneDACA004683 [Acorus gramineus]|uniref:Protein TRIGALACTOSYLDIACYLGLYCEROL 4, chloroplastic n=1 Tax=Acorus gramineus TaxID=55184 RepID=A0AAV9BU44_ACOGR|nr:hypothetical protein QJS04_geneDACA004683 [Acorus gramineus]
MTMRKLRWAMDGGYWDLDMSTPATVDGTARAVPGDPLPLSLSRGVRLSRPKQIDFMQRFMSVLLVPSYNGGYGGQGFSLQRVLSLPLGESCFATLLGQFHLQKFVSSLKGSSSRHTGETSWLKNMTKNLLDKSLYALGFCSEFLITPDHSLLLSSEANGDGKGRQRKAVFHQKLPQHNLTFEAVSPGLFVDKNGAYWDVPLSIAVDLASVAYDSAPSYHLSVQHNSGQPKHFGSDQGGEIPPTLLPGLCGKAAISYKKDVDIWRDKGGKLKMVQPYDVFMSDPHISVSGTIGAVITASLGDNSERLPREDELREYKALALHSRGKKGTLSGDLFSHVCCTAQYGNFQRLFFDLTRLNARLDFPSGVAFLAGASNLANDLYNSRSPNLKAVHAVCPDLTLSFQQQIAGPFIFRVDSKIAINLNNSERFARVDDTVIAVEHALKVLGSAKAIAWYSMKNREAMVELRFFEN